jgi:uncharacterized integral membrane protein
MFHYGVVHRCLAAILLLRGAEDKVKSHKIRLFMSHPVQYLIVYTLRNSITGTLIFSEVSIYKIALRRKELYVTEICNYLIH